MIALRLTERRHGGDEPTDAAIQPTPGMTSTQVLIERVHAQRRLYPAAVLGAVLLAAVLLFLARDFTTDSAFVTLRYARNIVDGLGWGWNPGEASPAQGYSHPLWLLLLLPGVAAGVAPIPLFHTVGFASVALSFLLVGFVGRRRPGGVEAILVLGSSLPLIAYAFSGLSTGLGALVTLVWGLLLQRATAGRGATWRCLAVGLAASLAALSRPELALLVVAGPVWAWRRGERRRAALMSAGAAPLLIAWGAFAVSTYGHALPNSWYVRTWGVPWQPALGARYLAVNVGDWLLPLASVLLLLRVPSSWLRLGAWVAGPLLGFVLLTGGDSLPHGRLLVPLGSFAVLTALHPEAMARTGGWQTAGTSLLVLTLLQPFVRVLVQPLRPDPRAVEGEVVGRMLHRILPPGRRVGMAAAGAAAWFSPEHEYIDLLGRSDRVIALREIGEEELRRPIQRIPGYAKGDGAYVLSRRPEVLIMGQGLGTWAGDAELGTLSEVELLRAPLFHQRYEVWTVPVPPQPTTLRSGDLWRHKEPPELMLYLRRGSAAYKAVIALPGAEQQ